MTFHMTLLLEVSTRTDLDFRYSDEAASEF